MELEYFWYKSVNSNPIDSQLNFPHVQGILCVQKRFINKHNDKCYFQGESYYNDLDHVNHIHQYNIIIDENCIICEATKEEWDELASKFQSFAHAPFVG